MTATAHSLVGACIAVKIGNPALAILIAFASNFLLDIVPHWDVGTHWHNRPLLKTFIYAGIDVFLGLGLSLLLFAHSVNLSYLLFLIFIATLADWLEAPYIFLKLKIPPFYQFYKIQSRFHKKDGSWFGVFTQFAVVLPLLLWAKL